MISSCINEGVFLLPNKATNFKYFSLLYYQIIQIYTCEYGNYFNKYNYLRLLNVLNRYLWKKVAKIIVKFLELNLLRVKFPKICMKWILEVTIFKKLKKGLRCTLSTLNKNHPAKYWRASLKTVGLHTNWVKMSNKRDPLFKCMAIANFQGP